MLAAVGVGAIAASSDRSRGDQRATLPRPTPDESRPTKAGTATRPPTTALEAFRVGQGTRSAEIVRPAGGDRLPGVIFLHGWGLVARSDYRPWIRHLARAGNQVIVPRYQRDERSDPGRALADALAGVRAALAEAPVAQRGLIVAGHSAGAALAADYAASASRRKLPPAVAIFSVYPGRRILGYPSGIPGVDPGRVPADTDIVAMAGANDVIVGQFPARELVSDTPQVPASRKRYVLVRGPLGGHYGPTRDNRPARRMFWRRLDRLIARARR